MEKQLSQINRDGPGNQKYNFRLRSLFNVIQIEFSAATKPVSMTLSKCLKDESWTQDLNFST